MIFAQAPLSPNDIQLAAQAAQAIGPSFWIWAIVIIFQTAVFSILGTWGVSRFVNRLSAEIRKEIDDAVTKLTEADSKVEKVTGDSINAMRQHVTNLEAGFKDRCHKIELKAAEDQRESEKRFHAAEKSALEDRNKMLEEFVRRDSFLHVTGKIETAVERLAKDMRDGLDKLDGKIDEIRDRKAA